MAIHKVIEVIAQSEKSWEDAAQSAVKDAGKTVKNIRSISIKNAEGVVHRTRLLPTASTRTSPSRSDSPAVRRG